MKARKPAIYLASLLSLALGSLVTFGCATRNPTPSPTDRAPETALYLGFETLSGPIRINRQDFATADLETIKSTSPTTDGGQYLQAAMILDPQFAQWVAVHGIPDAIGSVPGSEGQYNVFYLNPPRSYAIQKGAAVASLNDISRSVRRITFGEKPTGPPWPVLVPPESASAFGVPAVPPPPPRQFDWAAHAEDARKVRTLLTRVNGREAARANEILQRLKTVEQTQGIEWTVEVFSYQYRPLGFAVPDGSLFISDKLMQETTDAQLAAAMAHLMAHVRYGHYILVPVAVVKKNVAPIETTAKSETSASKSEPSIGAEKKKPNRAAVVALTALADTLIISWDVFWIGGGLVAGHGGQGAEFAFPPVSTEQMERALEEKPSPESVKQASLEGMKGAWPSVLAARQHDIEANYLAAKYLAGIDIPPDALFDMLMQFPLHPPLSLGSQIHSEKTAFTEMYDTNNNGAFDFGKMLDAGLIMPAASTGEKKPRANRGTFESQGRSEEARLSR
jgi:hypothetical protein